LVHAWFAIAALGGLFSVAAGAIAVRLTGGESEAVITFNWIG
jgi:hypothetical protein